VLGDNPNAAVAAIAGALTVLGVWIVGLFDVDVPPEVSSAATTVFVALLLFLGRRRSASP
jgi:hypothetical protein